MPTPTSIPCKFCATGTGAIGSASIAAAAFMSLAFTLGNNRYNICSKWGIRIIRRFIINWISDVNGHGCLLITSNWLLDLWPFCDSDDTPGLSGSGTLTGSTILGVDVKGTVSSPFPPNWMWKLGGLLRIYVRSESPRSVPTPSWISQLQ